MKFIVAPLIMAVGLFAASIVSAAAGGQEPNVANESSFKATKTSIDFPVGTMYAFWPDKKAGEDQREISIASDGGKMMKYVAVFKDPKDNDYDLSSPEAMAEAIVNDKPRDVGEIDPENVDHKVLFSVYLDKDDKVLYSVPGTNVPSSWKDVKNINDAISKAIIAKLDPKTTGIEDIKDPNAAMAQFILNSIAIQGSDALEEAKKNPALMSALDAAYEASRSWGDYIKDLEGKVAAEEAVFSKNVDSEKVKRHNKPHHHHHKTVSKEHQKN
ncbi:hypothetical protein BC939DRAFT_450719 [Gamsiella multidivaricata]|uniref:uncharacterized protein n=1 Tax=Gamsiella multidivaricata TaxID=101098 RepID=UPI00221F325D|nr:uncharacterized protein BC939DRAFT_450719 [Gamsiella multidivaricata]KAI7824142.1 hypothetical protein BC939DRAFT_450719 [Gamsiella multidivaricata]